LTPTATAPSRDIARLRVGGAIVTCVCSGRNAAVVRLLSVDGIRRARFDSTIRAAAATTATVGPPLATPPIPIDFATLHVAVDDLSIVVDPLRLNEAERAFLEPAGFQPSAYLNDVPSALRAIGVPADTVTHVVATHGHADHYSGFLAGEAGAAPAFSNARYLISRRDLDGVAPRHREQLRAVCDTLAARGLLDAVDGELELSASVKLLPTPGETPGHLTLRVESRGECFFWVGDLFHDALEIGHPDWVSTNLVALDIPEGELDATLAALRASRLEVLADAAAHDAVVCMAHAPFPGWGTITRVRNGYGFRAI